MRNVDYILLSDNLIQSIVCWSKQGVILYNNNLSINIDELFKENRIYTLELIEDLMEKVEIKKHFLQLKEIKEYLYEI